LFVKASISTSSFASKLRRFEVFLTEWLKNLAIPLNNDIEYPLEPTDPEVQRLFSEFSEEYRENMKSYTKLSIHALDELLITLVDKSLQLEIQVDSLCTSELLDLILVEHEQTSSFFSTETPFFLTLQISQ
jgi:hypothetical protein